MPPLTVKMRLVLHAIDDDECGLLRHQAVVGVELATAGDAGIDFSGDVNVNGQIASPTLFGRIVNNTVVGGLAPGASTPVTFSGITFPTGVSSFADAVVSYTPGNPAPTLGLNPNAAVGTPAAPCSVTLRI